MTATLPTSTLSERAMLVKRTIRQWAAKKEDKKITQEVATAHNAAVDSGKYNKSLLPKDALKPVQQAANAMRTEHYRLTLPWSDEGFRILSSAGYLAYTATMRQLEADFQSAVLDFQASYQNHIDDARARMNGLFNQADYPSVSEMAGLFGTDSAIRPLPDSGDFRAQLGIADVALIRQAITAEMDRNMQAAMGDIWQRMRSVVEAMAQKLSAYSVTADGKVEGVFRDSLVSNISDLCDIVPSLNITNDPNISAFADTIRASLGQATPEELRDNDALRAGVAQQAYDILSKMDAFI